ncbi:hypothetical protein [Pseudoalteromonas xiamenensis]|uniref:Uncharacterized protein n=1 Tax=Pseudoalteromonas xiamenensis TaxID=882626 RepID=A0A975DET3_9GAMM|nr:hypothetical protein [Pseudoalteromonas xiamenensis]QTH70442.1 hypothetical protein J5O05_10580 [Pseudoalteromonas xiamenensis]
MSLPTQYLSTSELCEILHIEKRSLHNRLSLQRKAIREGADPQSRKVQQFAPPSIKVGRIYLFRWDAVQCWLSRHQGMKM